MFYSLKRYWLLLVLLAVAGHRSAFGYATMGPFNESFQVPAIGYSLPGDIATPKDLGDEYRWNVPTVYYAYDATFLSYFGSNGVAATDAAFTILNNLTNVSSYSQSLSEWPLTSSRYNETAAALNLLDIKSTVLGAMMEQLALGPPDRYVWCLHDRFLPGGATCPNYTYFVIQRNFDPVTQVYSSYVNGTLYDYEILETCTFTSNPYPFPFSADAVPLAIDPSTSYSAVSAQTFQFGQYFTGLTRDDIGGLRYLYSSTNKFVESAGPNSLMLSTNKLSQLLTTSSLQLLTQEALTNPPAALQALNPALDIISFTNFFTNVVTTNVEAFFITNGNPSVVLVTNFTTNAVTNFSYTFGNVVTNHLYTNGYVVTQVTNVGPNPFAPILITNQFATLLTTSNLATLTEQSLTNPPAALQALYPDLVINSFTNIFTNVVTTNIFAFFTNNPLNPAGTLTLVLATNFTTNVATLFLYNFANVVTNHFYTKGFVTTQTTNVAFSTGPFGVAGGGTLKTNVTTKTVVATNFINGDYYIVPTNLFGYDILSTQLVSVIPITNVVVFATNAPGVVNPNGQSFTMNIITYFTNFNYITYPIVAFPGPVQTNVISTTNIGSFVNGDYYIVTSNLFGYDILSTQLVSVVPITNIVVWATNAPGVTATNLNFTENIITFSTNYTLVTYPIQLITNTVALREGIEKIKYIRRDFDSLLGTFWAPITNMYTLTAVTNSAPVIQTFERVVTQPDILFTAADLQVGPAALPAYFTFARTTNNWNTSQVPGNQPGPGTIEPAITITLDKNGPLLFNSGPFFIPFLGDPEVYFSDTNSVPTYTWGSFDGTTNAPIVYPDTISLASLESQVFFQVLNVLLPVGSVSTNNPSNPYNVQLQAQGASPPFTWTNPTGLPTGLSVSTNGVLSGSLSGAAVGTYDFTVQATDSVGRTAQSQLFIEVDP